MKFRSSEQTQYAKLIENAIKPGPPLLAGAAAGLGKTHGYSIPLIRSGKRIAMAMSTRQLMAQYLESAALRDATAGQTVSVVALQTRKQFDSAKAYREHREQAMQAQVLLVTHAAAFIDSLMPGYAELRGRDVILFDEADLLADAADLRSTFSIDQDTLKACKADLLDHEQAATLVKKNATETEDKAAAAAILFALAKPAWYKRVGREDDGSLTLKHRMPGRMLKRLVEDSPRCIFTSGTLQVGGKFDHFVQSLGLKTIDAQSRHIDPKVHGQLHVDLTSDELDHEQMAERIMQSARPVLVLTTSHTTTEGLGSACMSLGQGVVQRGAGESLADAVARCPDDGVLIAAGAWSGLDAQRLRWKTVVIPKAPYGPPAVLDGEHVSRYVDSKVVAIRRINQGLHRGLRTPDATCQLLLLDPRCSRLELREAIPARFKVDWAFFEEGSAVLRTHMAKERHAGLRNAALKHHGQQCMHEGCQLTDLHLLDVHHCKPINEGERMTSVKDVMVLCKNHHADAHHELRMAEISDQDSQ